jgi:hypothetical protein
VFGDARARLFDTEQTGCRASSPGSCGVPATPAESVANDLSNRRRVESRSHFHAGVSFWADWYFSFRVGFGVKKFALGKLMKC